MTGTASQKKIFGNTARKCLWNTSCIVSHSARYRAKKSWWSPDIGVVYWLRVFYQAISFRGCFLFNLAILFLTLIIKCINFSFMNNFSPRGIVVWVWALCTPICLWLAASSLLDRATHAKQEATRQNISVVLAQNVSSDEQRALQSALMLVRQHEERLRATTGQDFHFSISIDGKLLATWPYGESWSSTTVPLEESKEPNN